MEATPPSFEELARRTGMAWQADTTGAQVLRGGIKGIPLTLSFYQHPRPEVFTLLAQHHSLMPLAMTLNVEEHYTPLKKFFSTVDFMVGDVALDHAFIINLGHTPELRRLIRDPDFKALLFNLRANGLVELRIHSAGVNLQLSVPKRLVDLQFIHTTVQVIHWIASQVFLFSTGNELPRAPAPTSQPLGKQRKRRITARIPSGAPSPRAAEVPAQQPPTPRAPLRPPPPPPPQDIKRVVDQLLEGLTSGQREPHSVAAELRRHGAAALDAWIDLLAGFRHQQQIEGVLLALGTDVVPRLLARMENAALSFRVAEFLTRASPQFQQALVPALASVTHERTLVRLIEVCGECRPAGAELALQPLLEHASFLVRYEAELALKSVAGAT